MTNNYVAVPLDKDEIGLLLHWMYRAQASGPAASAIIRKLQNAKKELRLRGKPGDTDRPG